MAAQSRDKTLECLTTLAGVDREGGRRGRGENRSAGPWWLTAARRCPALRQAYEVISDVTGMLQVDRYAEQEEKTPCNVTLEGGDTH